MNQGSCACGKIKFEVNGNLGKSDACHCNECRKWTGHFLPSCEVMREQLSITGVDNLKWYHSSTKVRRGFCVSCGSSLFFDPIDQNKHQWIAIALGAFNEKTYAKLSLHMFVSEKGDYYSIDDGLPQNER